MGTPLISGPQGPRVVLDGRPVLLLCSNNALGLADHPRVCQAAADAAMRWGVGAGSARSVAGTMTLHRRLEDRLASFHGTGAALLFGSGYLAAAGVIPALAGRGDVVFADALNHPALVDGATLSGADVFVYDHADPEHLTWGLRQHPGRAGLIATESVFSAYGGVAPLAEIVAAAQRHDVRILVDESHALGALGPGGRGAVAEAGLEDGVDVLVGSLGTALGAYGGYAACDRATAHRLTAARTFASSTAPPPPAVAGALEALELLAEQPRRIAKLMANADVLRTELAREGYEVSGSSTHIVFLVFAAAADAQRVAQLALEEGVHVALDGACLRLAVMAAHTRSELREAAQVLGRAALRCGVRPGTLLPVTDAHALGEVVPLHARRAA